MNKSLLFIAILLMMAATSCHKEPEKTIVFGDTKGMRVEKYNTYINLGKTMTLDVDTDGNDDLKFVSYYDGPLGGTTFQMLHLECLSENVELLGEMMEKKRYMHRDTTILTNSEGWTTVLYFTNKNLCEPLSENDEVRITNSFILSASNANDPFNIDDCFKYKDKVYLFIEDTNNGPVDDVYNSNDTTYVWDSNTTYSCDAFPTNTETYIGIKINENGTPHLGWLKLNLIGDETVNVHLIETAIQK